ncbi:MAG: hypothetical protein AB1384_07795, partial [Actinomycetota bacterium]
MNARKTICCVLIVALVSMVLPHFGFGPPGGQAVAAEAAAVSPSTASLTSALKSLEKGASEVVDPGNPQGNLGTFFQYYLSADPTLQALAAGVIGPNLNTLNDLLTSIENDLEQTYQTLQASGQMGDTAYTLSTRGGGFFDQRARQYYLKDFLGAWSVPLSPAQAWNNLEPDIPALIPPSPVDMGSFEDDEVQLGLDQLIGYSQGLILPDSDTGLLEQAFLDVLAPLWSSMSGAGADFSTSYESSLPIVAERVMYTTGDLRGATAMRQSPAAATHHFAEGFVSWDPSQTSETYFLLQNREDQPASVVLTFYPVEGEPVSTTVEVPPHSRHTVSAGSFISGEFSTRVESDLPVSAERSVYLQGRLYGSTCEHGAELSTSRYFSEGCVTTGFDTYFTLFNPGEDQAEAEFTFMLNGGETRTCRVAVPPGCRRTLNAAESVQGEFCTRVTSDRDIAVERLVYATGGENALIGATCSQGLSGLSRTRHFAEGYAASGDFSTFFTLGNHGGSPAEVTLAFLTASGEEKTCRVMVPATSRYTVNAAEYVSGEFSVVVEADSDVMVERAVYAAGNGPMRFMGATVDHGLESPATQGNFPEGSRRVEIGSTTYLTLNNPDEENAAEVEVTCESADGHTYVHRVSVPPRSRHTINLGQANHDQLVQNCYDFIETLFLREVTQQLIAAAMYVDVTRIYYDWIMHDESGGRDIAASWIGSYLQDILPPQVEEFLAVTDALACNQIDLFDPLHTGGIQAWGVIQDFEGRAAFLANQLLHPCDYFNPRYGDADWDADRSEQCALTLTWITDRGAVPESASLALSTRYKTASGYSDWTQVLNTQDCVADYQGSGGAQALFNTATIMQHTTDLTGGRVATMWFDRWYWTVYGGKAMHTVTPETDLLLVKFLVPGVDLDGVSEVDFKIDVVGTTLDSSGTYTNESGVASGDDCGARNAAYGTFTGTVAGDPSSQGPVWYASTALIRRSGGLSAFDQTKIGASHWSIDGVSYENASMWTSSSEKGGDWHNTDHDSDLGGQTWSHNVSCDNMGWPHGAHTYRIHGYVHRDFLIELPDYQGCPIPPPSEGIIEFNGNFRGFSSSHANPACWFAYDWGSGDHKGYKFNDYDGSDIKHYDGTLAIPGTRTGWFPEIPLNQSVKVHSTSTIYAYDHTNFEGSGWPSGRKAEFDCDGVFLYFQGYGRPDSWMGDLGGIIGPYKLNEICIPGTHDSGTEPIGPDSHVNAETGFDWKLYAGLIEGFVIGGDMEAVLLAMAGVFGPVDFLIVVILGIVAGELAYDLGSKSGLATVQANWSRAQGAKIGEQLNEGIRYLDLRVVKYKDSNGGDYVLSHSMTGEHLDDVLQDVKNFHASNPTEFIILDINKVFMEQSQDDSNFDHAAFIQHLKSKLGTDCLIPRTAGSLKLDDLWKDPKRRIIIFYCNHDTVAADTSLWFHCGRDSFDFDDYSMDPNSSKASWIMNPWPDTDSTDYLIDEWRDFARDHSGDVQTIRDNGSFFVMQSQMTDQSKKDAPQRNQSMVLGGLAWLARKHKHQFIVGPILWAATKGAAGKSPDEVPVCLEELAEESNPDFFQAALSDSYLHDFALEQLNIVTCDFATEPLLPTGIPGQGQTLFDFTSAVNMDRYDPGRHREEVPAARRCAHDSVGATAPAASWYLAEGSTAGGMETYVLVQNPGDTEARVD